MKKNNIKIFQKALLPLLAIALTSTTLILGAVPLRVLTLLWGLRKFCIFSGVVTALIAISGLVPLAASFLALSSVVAIFYYMDQKGRGLFVSGLSAVAGASIIGVGFFVVCNSFSLIHFWELLSQQVEQFIFQVKQINPKIKLKPEPLLEQLPSICVIMLTFSLSLSLILQKKALSWLGIKDEGAFRHSLTEFKMPDVAVWILIVSFLLSFKNFDIKGVEILATNSLNILIALFFWQGIAIMATFFKVKRVGVLWQYLAYLFLITQFFIGVTFLGVMDFWMEFRAKIQQPKGESV